MINKTIGNFNLQQLADSGQCFRWRKLEENTYFIPQNKGGLTITIEQNIKELEGGVFSLDCTEEEWNNVWYRYFDMDTDYGRIGKLIMDSDDDYLKRAYSAGTGVRILRQDLWEVLVSFIISQNNNIKRIKGSIEKFAEKAKIYEINTGKEIIYSFPEPGEISEDFDFSDLGMGYRDAYLSQIYSFARLNPEWLPNLWEMDYDAAMKTLLERTGVGPKVANCVCLFGLHHVDAFPIDTHIKQILKAHYPQGFPFDRYEGIAGIIQQYIFFAKQYLKI